MTCHFLAEDFKSWCDLLDMFTPITTTDPTPTHTVIETKSISDAGGFATL